jgi:hypothetical protein
MNSDDIEQIIDDAIEDLMDDPETNEEVLVRFKMKVLRKIRLWED